MAIEPSSARPSTQRRFASSHSWLYARALWAGLSIIFMWLAVLFVGVFGGDFVSSTTSGFTRIPVVVFILPFVLPATIVVGRAGFASSADQPRDALDETPEREERSAEPSPLRAKPA